MGLLSSVGFLVGVVNDSGYCWIILILIRRDLYKDIYVVFVIFNLVGYFGGVWKIF